MRRLVEIAALDLHGVEAQEELLPRKRSVFYALPPYIRHVDLAHEVIVVSNPENTAIDLTGHYLTDRGELHRFDFEDGFILPAAADVHIYCAPGKYGVDDEENPPDLYLLWTNKDGKPRRREVLNPVADKITLFDPNGVELAALDVTEHGAKRFHLYRLEHLHTRYAGRVVTSMQGLRLGFVISAFVNLLVNNLSYLLLFEVLAMVCDVVARLADALRLPKSKARVFAILADRVEIITLLGALLVGLQTAEGGYYEPNPVPRVKLALGLLLIEVLVSWAEVLVESLTTIKTVAATPFMNKADALVIQRGPYRKWLTQKILKKIPWFITSITAGNHIYLFLAVANLAHEQEGENPGLVTKGIDYLQSCWQYLPLPAFLAGHYQFLISVVVLAAGYRCLLLWAAVMDILEVRQ